jgi:cytochrome c
MRNLAAAGLLAVATLAAGAEAVRRDHPRLGRPAGPAEFAAWDLTIYPDGAGLPVGQGTAAAGKAIFLARCAGCHGAVGEGATADELAGGRSPLNGEFPDKNIGNYWPHATTLFDFTRRAMPMDAPGALTTDEVYAVTAYLLFLNGLIREDEIVNAETLSGIPMPNRDGFVWIDAPVAKP